MIFNVENEKIIRLALAGQSNMTDGCALYDADNGKMVTGSYTTGTIENPENHLVEVFRFEQGGTPIDFGCDDCPFRDEDGDYDEDMVDEYGDTRIDCCIGAYLPDFNEDFDDNYRESVEEQVRELIKDLLYSSLDKVDDVRLAILDKVEPWNYVNNRANNRFVEDSIDEYVDMAMEQGFILETDPLSWIDAEIENVAFMCDDKEDAMWSDVAYCIREHDFDGALKLLQ